MPTIRSLIGNGRAAGIARATILCSIVLFASPVLAQASDEGVPPWQRPPGQSSRFREAAIEHTEFVPQGESVTEGKIGQPARSPAGAPRNMPGPDGSTVIGSGAGEDSPWAAEECTDCEYENCLNPFPNRLWVRGEFLAMFGKSASLQPLATTSSPSATRPQAGVLGQPTTSVLFGADDRDPGILPGGRFTLGYKCSPCAESGFEVTYMFLADESANFRATSDATPIIARPFFNVETNVQDSLVVAFPGQQAGGIAISLSDEFNSLEALWRQSICTPSGRRLDFLFGYRYGHFTEILNVNSISTFTGQVGVIPIGTVSVVNDRFSAINNFQGGELGLSTRFQRCRWSMDVQGKFAMGNTRSLIDISGNSSITVPPSPPTPSNGGLLALPTNIGRFEENNFTVIPELGITIGYDLTDRLKASFGYTFLYWSRVARPGDQLDLNVNPSQLSGGTLTNNASPQFRFVPGDYWVQGVTLGLDYRF
jgi:hypothetical protein